MTDNNIPESEVNWLYGIDKDYKIKLAGDTSYIYPVALLPPTLKSFVKKQNISTEYINMGPVMGYSDGMLWSIWGWKALPTTSTTTDANWSTTINAEKKPPTMDDLQEKINHIQSELTSLNNLIKRYKGAI